MSTRLRTRTAAAVAISALLLTACGQNPEEEPPALGSDDGTTAEAGAEPTSTATDDAADDAPADDASADRAGDDGAGDDSAAAELPEVSADTCAAFEEFEDGFPGNTEADPEAAASWMDEQADAGDEQYKGQLRGLAEATRAYGEGHKPLTALEGQMRGLHEHCTHGG